MPGGAQNHFFRACFNISTCYLAIGRPGSFGVCRPLLRTIYETVLVSVVFYAEDSQERGGGGVWEGQEAAQHTSD